MTLLPGFRFEVYPGFVDLGLIAEIGHYTEQPHWAHTERDGKKWVAKLGRDSAGRGIAAEAFSWLLGREIGLRVPSAAIAVDGLKRAWLSERIEGARNWDLDAFVGLYKPAAVNDKCSLDLFWLKDESLLDADNLPEPDVSAREIAEDLRGALAQIEEMLGELEVEP